MIFRSGYFRNCCHNSPIAHPGIRFQHTCLVDALRHLGYAVPYDGDGPFYAMADGNRMLAAFGQRLQPVTNLEPNGRYVIWTQDSFHYVAVRSYREGLDFKDGRQSFQLDFDHPLTEAVPLPPLPGVVFFKTGPSTNSGNDEVFVLVLFEDISVSKLLCFQHHFIGRGGAFLLLFCRRACFGYCNYDLYLGYCRLLYPGGC
jgi:hypothetical protein